MEKPGEEETDRHGGEDEGRRMGSSRYIKESGGGDATWTPAMCMPLGGTVIVTTTQIRRAVTAIMARGCRNGRDKSVAVVGPPTHAFTAPLQV